MDHHHNQSSYSSYYGNGNGNGGSGGGGYYSRDGNNNYHHGYYQNGNSNHTNHSNFSIHHHNAPSSSLARSNSSSYYNDSDYSKPPPSSWDRGDYYHEASRYSKSFSNDLYYSDPYYSKRLDPLYPSTSSTYPDNNRKYDYDYPSVPSSSYRTTSNDRYYEAALVPPSSSAGYQNPYPDTFYRPGGFFNDNRIPPISSYDPRVDSNRFPPPDISGYPDRRWAPSKLDSSRADRWSKFDTYSHSLSSFSSTNPLTSSSANQTTSLAESPSKKPFSWKPRESRFAPLSPFKAKTAITPSKVVPAGTNESKDTSSKKKAVNNSEVRATTTDGKESTTKEEKTSTEADSKGEDPVVKEEKVIEKIQDPAVEILVKNCLNFIDYKMSLALLPLGLSFATLKAHLPVPEPKIEIPVVKIVSGKEIKEVKAPTTSTSNTQTIQPKPSEMQLQPGNEIKSEDKTPIPQKRPSENLESEQQKKKLKSNDPHESATPNKQQNTAPLATAKPIPSSGSNSNISNGRIGEASNANLAMKQPVNHNSATPQTSFPNSAQKNSKDPSLSSNTASQPVTPHVLKTNPNNVLPPSIQKPSQSSFSRASSINTPNASTPATISKKPQTPYNSTPHQNPHPSIDSTGSSKKDFPPILSNASSSTKPKTPHSTSNPVHIQAQTPNVGIPSSSGMVGYNDGPDRRPEDWNTRARDDWNRGNGDYRSDRRYDPSIPVGPPFSATKYPESDLRRNASGEWREDRYRYDYNHFPPSASTNNLGHGGGYSGKYDPNYPKFDEPYNRGRSSREEPPYYPGDYPLPPTIDPMYPAPRGNWDSINRGWNESDRGKMPYDYGNSRSSYPPSSGPPPSAPRREGHDYYDSKYYDRKNYY